MLVDAKGRLEGSVKVPRKGWLAVALLLSLTGACGGSADTDAGSPDTSEQVTQPQQASQTTTTPPQIDSTSPVGTDLSDPCLLLTDDEAAGLIGDGVTSAEDDLGSPFLRQCTYTDDRGGGLSVQVAAAGGQDEGLFGFESDDVDIRDLDGIGEWAFVVINHEDPSFGISASVLAVSAGSGGRAVNFFPYAAIFPDEADFEDLLDLLSLAVSRLPNS